MATTVSAVYFTALKHLKINNSTLTFSPKHPKHFGIDEIRERASVRHDISVPGKYTAVRVTVRAKSPEDAQRLADESLEVILGAWNFAINYRQGIPVYSGPPAAINRIVSGPLYTLHHSTGKAATDDLWYREDLRWLPLPSQISQHWASMARTIQQIRNSIRRTTHPKKKMSCGKTKRETVREELYRILQRYNAALSETGTDAAFLQLWALLEKLTGCVGRDHKAAVRRAAFGFREFEYHEYVLDYLRRKRNDHVHRARPVGSTQTPLHLLRRYVEALILFHLDKLPKTGSVAEAAEKWLQLPRDAEVLRTDIKRRQWALRIHGG